MVTGSAGVGAHARTRINWRRAGTVAGALLLVIGVLTLVALRTTRAGVLPGVELLVADGPPVQVGALSEAELVTVVREHAISARDETVHLTHGTASSEVSAADLGVEVDVDQTVAAVMGRGRQLNPLAALGDHVRATVTTVRVIPVAAVDEARLADATAQIARDVGLEPSLGAVAVSDDGQASVEMPAASEIIDTDELGASLVGPLFDADPDVADVEVPTEMVRPDLDPATRAQLEADAERAISAPVTVTTRATDWTLDPDTLAALLAVRPGDGSGEDGAEVVIDPDRLAGVVPFDPLALATAPTDATFDVIGGTPQLVPSRSGFVFDIDIAAAQLTALATSPGPRTAPLEGREVEPDRSSEDLTELGIERPVSTFSTEHPCCEGRVQNIHRIADLVDGFIVRPGQTFSLNDAGGPRTRANGFVEGGAIESGEFVDQVGGGVSQFATTLFNAVFFAGYEIAEFQPHSYYIPRYPLGREATLNDDPPIDFRFVNNSPDGILISATYTDTSVTVSLFSTVFAAVESTTSDRYGFREPELERRQSPDLPAGEEQVEQRGQDGFSVDVTREITYVDGRGVRESFTTVYRAQPRVVLIGIGDQTEAPASPQPDVPADATADDGPRDDASDDAAPDGQPGPTATVEPVPDPGPVDVTPEPVPDPPSTTPDPGSAPDPVAPPDVRPPGVTPNPPTPEPAPPQDPELDGDATPEPVVSGPGKRRVMTHTGDQ